MNTDKGSSRSNLPMLRRMILAALALGSIGMDAALSAADAAQAVPPTFFDTSAANANQWLVSANVSGVDVTTSTSPLFLTGAGDFQTAAGLPGRADWIHSNPTGSTGSWTQFVFRQSLDLTGYDVSSGSLSFPTIQARCSRPADTGHPSTV